VRGDTHVNPFPKMTRQRNRYGDAYVLAVHIARKKNWMEHKKKITTPWSFCRRRRHDFGLGVHCVYRYNEQRASCVLCLGDASTGLQTEYTPSFRIVYVSLTNIFNIASRSYYIKNGVGTAIVPKFYDLVYKKKEIFREI